jgi:hypothetical protein
LVELPHPFVYGTRAKIARWTPGSRSAAERAERIAGDLDWADAIMAYDHPFYVDAALESGKPVLFRAFGQSTREHAPDLRRLLRSPTVVRATVGLPDLAVLTGLELVGAPYPLIERADPMALVLCHAPSDRESKGTATILEAAGSTPWAVDVIEKQPNFRVMKHKRRAALIVDSFNEYGYGVNAIEGMALGLPVVAGGSRAVREYWRRPGSPVVFVTDKQDLRRTLVRLADDAELRARLGEKGREFVARFHSGEARAAEDLAALGVREQVAA